MTRKIKFIFIFLIVLIITSNLQAILTSKLIDTPVNNFYAPNEVAIDYYMYKNGGVITWVEMGVKPPLNLGFSVDFNSIIGDKQMKTREPKISVRWRIFRGTLNVPAINIGYLGQGYGEKIGNEYETREKGFYIACEREIFLPYLIWNFGVNTPKFDKDDIFGFINLRYLWQNSLLFMLEYDNIRTAPNACLNFGFRYFIVDNLSMGFAVRKLNKREKTVERVLMITYIAHVNFFESY
ncbi:MAG: hypothetical protein GY817_09050 [bacterium]|nr:hypothetical protein [bacterium]